MREVESVQADHLCPCVCLKDATTMRLTTPHFKTNMHTGTQMGAGTFATWAPGMKNDNCVSLRLA